LKSLFKFVTGLLDFLILVLRVAFVGQQPQFSGGFIFTVLRKPHSCGPLGVFLAFGGYLTALTQHIGLNGTYSALEYTFAYYTQNWRIDADPFCSCLVQLRQFLPLFFFQICI
jgi:hypothetical protein